MVAAAPAGYGAAMPLRTVVALLVTTVLASAPAAAVTPHPEGRAAYPEPQAGLWDYDRYISPTEIGRFRVKAGKGTKPPKVVAVRFRVESAFGKCPKLGTLVTVVAKPLALTQAPDLAEGRSRYQWALAQNTTYDEDYSEHNYGLEPVPVSVRVGGAAPVHGALSMLLQQSFEGGKWRWVVTHTVLSFKSCWLDSLSGRPASDR
jgi:hypothetical protein